MATRDEYNNAFPSEQLSISSSYQPNIKQNGNQPYYENLPEPSQVVPVPKSRKRRAQEDERNLTDGGESHIEQHIPNQNTQWQAQWTSNQGPPNQHFPGAESFNGQGRDVVKNYTGESTHSEELRQDPHPHKIGTTEHDPAFGQPKPNKAAQTEEAVQGQRPKIFSQVLAIAVKPEEAITKNKSYHNEISGEEAIKRLRAFGNHHYLTRHSEYWKCYVLSVYMSNEDLENEKYKHFPLKVSGEGIRIQEDETFENLEKMLKYYQNNRLDPAFPTIGECITEEGYKEKARQIRELQKQKEQQEVQPQQQKEEEIQVLQPVQQVQRQQTEIQVLPQVQLKQEPPQKSKCTIL